MQACSRYFVSLMLFLNSCPFCSFFFLEIVHADCGCDESGTVFQVDVTAQTNRQDKDFSWCLLPVSVRLAGMRAMGIVMVSGVCDGGVTVRHSLQALIYVSVICMGRLGECSAVQCWLPFS